MKFSTGTVISSMIWKLFERFSSQIASFVISIILARILMPSDYGTIALILVFVALANVIVDGGLNTALVQKRNADQTDFSTIFWFCLLASILVYAVIYFASPLVSRFYDNEILTPVLRVLGLSIIPNAFNSIQRAYVSRNMLFRKLFYVNVVAVVFSGLLGIWMACRGMGVWALVGQSLSSPVLCCVIMWFVVKWRPSFEFSFSRFKGLFDYGWKIFTTYFIICIYENVRSLIIGKIYQPATLAFFDRGKLFPSLLISNITSSIETVMLPTFSEEQDDTSRVKQMMRRSVQVSYLFVAPLLVGLFFAANELVTVLLTAKWLPAVPFIRIFCIAFLLMPIQTINITAIKSLGYSSITLKLEIIKKILEAVILVVSFMINVYAVAWGIVVYNFICIFINLHPSKRLVGYGWAEQVADIMPTLALAFIMGGAVYLCGLLPVSSLLKLIAQFVAGVLTYYALCRVFRIESLQYIFSYAKEALKAK